MYLRDASGTDGGSLWVKSGEADTAWTNYGAISAAEIGYIRSFIGKPSEGNVMPDYSSVNVIADLDSLVTALGKLDTEIGAAVVPNVRTNNPILDQAINLNINALDDAIGTDAQIVNHTYIALANSVNSNLSALDGQVKANSDAIDALESGLKWLPSVKATTADDISAFSGTSVTFSDDEIGITVALGDRVASSFDDKIYVVNAGTWTVAADGALATGDSFFSTYCFIFSASSSLQGPHAVSFNGTNLIKLAQFDFEYANTIQLATGYTPTNGTITTADTVQSAIEKLDGNQIDLTTLSGVAQGAVNLGSFTGAVIPDDQNVKQALQALETSLDTANGDIDDLEAATGTTTGTAGLLYTQDNYVTDNQSLKASVDALDIGLGESRKKTTANSVTSAVTVDSVLVDNYHIAKWMLVAYETATPDKKEAYELFAVHDGTVSADAVATDYTLYAKLKTKTAPISGLTIAVDVNGTGAAQVMRLRVASTTAVNVVAIRMVA